MGEERLAQILREAYRKAPRGQKTLSAHLFGFCFADELRGLNIREIRERAKISRLEPTIRDGMNLSRVLSLNDSGRVLIHNLGFDLSQKEVADR